MKILPFYSISNNSIVEFIDNCNTLSGLCKKCKLFNNRKLCTDKKDNITICHKGLSVYWDSAHDKFYFSLRINGIFNSSKVKCNDTSFKCSKKFFMSYLRYENNQCGDELLNVFDVFCDNLTLQLQKLKDIISPLLSEQNAVIELSRAQLMKLNQFTAAIGDLRIKTSYLIDNIEARTTTFFYTSTHPLASCCPPHYQCKKCKNQCLIKIEDLLSCCPLGIKMFSKFNVNFRGILSDKEASYSNAKDQLILQTQIAEQILREDSWIVSRLSHFQRFIHDITQYIGGLCGLIPEVENDVENYYVRSTDIVTANVFCDAITVLADNAKMQFLSILRETKIQFEPYKLFDKYRLCFSEIAGVQIKLERTGNQQIKTKVIGSKRFELVVLNILLNAVKYLPPNPYKDRTINIKFVSSKNLDIFIESYGPPIAESEIENLGTSGFRGANAISYGISGKGLGLNLVKELCQKSEYNITFTSSQTDVIDFRSKKYSLFCAHITIPHELCV